MTKAEGSMRDLARVKGSRGVLIPELQAVALKASGHDPTRRTDILHPSELAKADWCCRASYFRITTGKLPPAEKFSFQMETIFLEGNWAHEKYQHWMRQTGKLWGEWGCLLCATRVTGLVPPLTGCRNEHGHMWKYLEVALAHEIVAGHEDGAMDDYMVEIKGLALDTPVPTPSGWTTMGAVSVGDQLIGSNGYPATVTAKSPVKRIGTYRVFLEGVRDPIICDTEHFWKVTSGQLGNWQTEQVLGVKEIRDTLRYCGQRQHRVANTEPVLGSVVDLQFGKTSSFRGVDWMANTGKWRARANNKHLGLFPSEDAAVAALRTAQADYDPTPFTAPTDSYVTGVFIGDGTQRNGSAFITGMPDIFDTLADAGAVLGPPNNRRESSLCVDRCVHGLVSILRGLGIPPKFNSPVRWIPPVLLRASVAQRLALLQGLMDSDGTWMKGRNQAAFGSTSKQLADDVYELVASLGERPNRGWNTARGFGLTVTNHYVRWTPRNFVPFRLSRKAEQVSLVTDAQRTRSRYRMITRVEAGPDVPTQCVSVDSSDHTYLCGRSMTPTHNTVGLGTVRIDAPEVLSRYYVETVDGGKIYDLDKFFKELSHPLQSHVRQGNVYLWLAREMGLPFKTVRFLYEFKPTQAVKEFAITLSDRIMEPILTGINAVQYALDQGEPPECPHGGCKQCSAYHELLGMEDAGKTRSERAEHRTGVTRRKPGDAAGGPVPRAGVVRRRGHPEGPGDRPEPVGEASGAGAPRGPRRRDRTGGPAVDAAVRQPEQVDPLPVGPAGSRSGRRVVRRKTSSD